MHFSFLFNQNIYRIDSSVNWKYMVPLNHSSISCLEFLCASLVRGLVGCLVGWLKEKVRDEISRKTVWLPEMVPPEPR